MRCFLCKKCTFEKVYSLNSKDILRCKNDGLFVAEKTNEDKTYGKEYFSNEPNKFIQSYFLNKLTSIKRLIEVKKPKILDIGCGWGDFEEVLEDPLFVPLSGTSRGREKIPYLGIDVNKEAIEICQKKGLNCKLLTVNQLSNYKKQEIPLRSSSFEGQARNKQITNIKKINSKKIEELRIENWNLFGKLVSWKNLEFDCITLFQVIEHLKNPLPILQSAKQLLKPGGIILITTPNNNSPLRKIMMSKWSVYTEPSHYVFFNKLTLYRTLELAGFKNIKVGIDRMRFLSSNYILSRLRSMYFPSYKLPTTNYLLENIPIPTDPFGDLMATAS